MSMLPPSLRHACVCLFLSTVSCVAASIVSAQTSPPPGGTYGSTSGSYTTPPPTTPPPTTPIPPNPGGTPGYTGGTTSSTLIMGYTSVQN